MEFNQYIWQQKIRIIRLACSVDYMITCFAIMTVDQPVTDADRQRPCTILAQYGMQKHCHYIPSWLLSTHSSSTVLSRTKARLSFALAND